MNGAEEACEAERLVPQIHRVLKPNKVETITDDLIESAVSTLSIGSSESDSLHK